MDFVAVMLFTQQHCHLECHMSLFLCLSGISLGWYCQKKSCQKQGVRKKDKKRGWLYYRGYFLSKGVSNLLPFMVWKCVVMATVIAVVTAAVILYILPVKKCGSVCLTSDED